MLFYLFRYPLTSELVFEYLCKLECNFSPGPDNVLAFILKSCAAGLCIPLSKIFNRSIKLGYFPTIWKNSFLIAFFKSGSRSDISNYRGIAKLSSIPKLFEKILTDILVHNVRSIISPSQHGFLQKRTVVTILLEFTSSVYDGFRLGKQTDVVYTDFSKSVR